MFGSENIINANMYDDRIITILSKPCCFCWRELWLVSGFVGVGAFDAVVVAVVIVVVDDDDDISHVAVVAVDDDDDDDDDISLVVVVAGGSLKFIIGSGCFAIRVDSELVSAFWVARSDWIILSFYFSSFQM